MTKKQEVINNLIGGWEKINEDSKPPYIFPDDKDFFSKLKEKNKYWDYVSDVKSFLDFIEKSYCEKGEEGKLHLNLLPIPYIGNLEKSSIFILQENPSLGLGDYFAEENYPPYRKALIRNLHQRNDKFPFLFLNPKFYWHPGFIYWNDPKRFGIIIKQLCEDYGWKYKEAASFLAQNISVLQLVPYHSKSSPSSKILNKKNLKSVEGIINYVNKVILPKVNNNEATLIVMRKWRDTNIDAINYNKNYAHSGSLKKAKETIIERLRGIIEK